VLDDESQPELCEAVDLDGITVEEVQQGVIAIRPKAKCPDEAGDAQKVAAHTESGESQDEPEVGAVPGEGRSEQADGVPPSDSKFHNKKKNVAIDKKLAYIG